MAYQYLFEPEIQYQTKDGRNNTAGFLRVYLAATDDPATTYSDFGGTRNPQDIILDDDGRAVVIVDDSKAYRLEVYDREGMLQFTCQPVTAVGGGSGGASIVQVVSTDGTVSVTKTTAAGITTYDLSTAFEPEAARWARRTGTSESLVGDEDWHELDTFADIGSTSYFNGWKLSKDCAYDLAASMEMPAGYDGAINTVSVKFVVEKDGVLQDVQFGHVDPTTNMDRVSFEYKGAGLAGEKINARLFYRTRQDMPIALESEVFYNEEADSVTGGGGLGDLTAGDYIEITEDHVINATGIQPEITWSYDNATISAINGSAVGRRYDGIYPIVVDNNQNTVAVDHTGLAVDETMTAYSSADHIVIGVASGQFQPSGSYLSSNALDGISGAWNEVSAKLDSSASGQFYPSSNPSGFITGIDLTPYQKTADMSAYARESSLSAKLDASASGEFYPSSNPSGFLTAHQSLAGYATEAYVDSSVSSKLDTTAFSTVSGDFLTSHQSLAGYATESYVDSAVSGKLDVTASSQFLTSLPDDLAYTSDVASAVSGKMDKSESSSFYPMDSNPSGYLTAHQSLAGYATETYVDSAVSGKLDSTAYDSAEFYSTSNPSGFVDAASASAIASAYSESAASGKLDATAQVVTSTGSASAMMMGGTSYYASQINGLSISAQKAYMADEWMHAGYKLDKTAFNSSEFYSTSNPSGFVDSAYVESAVSSKQDTLTFDWDADSAISSINGSALAGNGGVDESAVSAIASAYAESAASGKQASGDYISAKGFGQVIGQAHSTEWIAFGNPTASPSYNHAGIYLSGQFGTAFYKDNELNLNRGPMKIAFNIGGAGPKISAMGAGAEMRLFNSGKSSGHYTIYGFSSVDSAQQTVAKYGSAEYTQLTSMYDTVSANSASWGQGGVDSATVSAIASSYAESAASGKVDQSAYDDLYSAFTALSGVISTYSGWFGELSSISAKVDNSAIGVIE